jgi:hypothetical protein
VSLEVVSILPQPVESSDVDCRTYTRFTFLFRS